MHVVERSSRASARPRLLYLCQENPWPLNSGALIRNYWFVRALSERCSVDLVTCDESREPVPEDFRGCCDEIIRFPRPRGWRAGVLRLGEALRPGGAYFTAGYVTAPMRAAVRRLVEDRAYRAIMLDVSMRDVLPSNPPALIYNAHNCESELLRRRARIGPLPARLAIGIEARRLRAIEARFVRRAALVTACSEQDLVDLQALCEDAPAKTTIVPNGVDLQRYEGVLATPPVPGTLLITGSFDWQPNRAGLTWFLREVLPHLSRIVPNLRVRVAGRMSARLSAQLQAIPKVTAAPNVPDMRTELERAWVVAAPVLASSGTRLRILEAWAAGRPVVTTPQGAMGLSYRDGIDVVVRSDPEGFTAAIADLMRSPMQWAYVRDAALRTAQRLYGWTSIGAMLVASLEGAGLLDAEERRA